MLIARDLVAAVNSWYRRIVARLIPLAYAFSQFGQLLRLGIAQEELVFE